MMPPELIIGRGLACCLYPRAAWRVLTRSGRALVVAAYGAAGFVVTLATLLWL
jgi:hypothetical protein